MTALVLLDAEIIAGPLRLTTISNETTVELEGDELDTTVFGLNGWKRKKIGLRSSSVSSSGFWDTELQDDGALSPDGELWTQFASSRQPVIVSPTGDELGVAYIVPSRRSKITMFGQVGEVAPYSSEMLGDGQAARGALLHSPQGLVTASGSGAAYVAGAVAAGQSLVASINVLALGGISPEIDIVVEHDDNPGFTSATTIASASNVTAPEASLTVAAGPITDDRYRVTWTLTGTNPTARFAVAVGTT